MDNMFERLTRNLVRRGVRDGLFGRNGAWLAIGAAAWLVRFLARTPEKRVVTETIRLGETIVVSSVAPAGSRRRSRRAGEGLEASSSSAPEELARPGGRKDDDGRRDR